LKHVAKHELDEVEKQFKEAGFDLSLHTLSSNGILHAPLDMHTMIQNRIKTLLQIDKISFDIKCSLFATMIDKEPSRLLSIVAGKCYLEKDYVNCPKFISIPQVKHSEPNARAASKSSSATSISIGQSSMSIVKGDLVEQAVSNSLV
jgi:hypothetical protein